MDGLIVECDSGRRLTLRWMVSKVGILTCHPQNASKILPYVFAFSFSMMPNRWISMRHGRTKSNESGRFGRARGDTLIMRHVEVTVDCECIYVYSH
jgi:hypothetical protein